LSDERKYRHRGYQDSGSEPTGRRPSGPRPPRDEGAPRGRGIDQNKAVVFRCKHCGERVVDLDSIGFEAVCRKCGADLHSCSQCTYFDTSARFECVRPIPERIPSKKARNTCTFYAPAKTFDLTGSRAVATPDDARSAFDALFNKK
jgi:DNA-directed RNA polymerase subunit RPC12/RpoP